MKTVGVKVVVLGSQGVGKTSLVTSYETKTFHRNTSSTIGASFSNVEIVVNGTKTRMQVWDTAGQERFRAMAPMYYRGANAALLVFDLTNYSTFTDVQSWVSELTTRVGDRLMLVLVGNKVDLIGDRTVSKSVAEDYAASIGADFVETSALNSTGIEHLFNLVAAEMVKRAEDENNSDLSVYSPNGKNQGGQKTSSITVKESSTPGKKSACC